MPRLLDLFCGAGGAGKGYELAGFDVVGVDSKPQPNYPFEFHHGDALEFLRAHGREFDVIHASPPCQAYCNVGSVQRARMNLGKPPHPELIEPVREILLELGRHYVIENVVGAPLHNPVMLCGSAFGLRVRRHRLFESSVALFGSHCAHRRQGRSVGVYGHQGNGSMRPRENGGPFIRAKDRLDAGHAMGIDWMSWRELTQAIPPAYTKFLGRQLLQYTARPCATKSATAPSSSARSSPASSAPSPSP